MMRLHSLRVPFAGIAEPEEALAAAKSMAAFVARPFSWPGDKRGSSRPLTWRRPVLGSAGDAGERAAGAVNCMLARGGAAVYTKPTP